MGNFIIFCIAIIIAYLIYNSFAQLERNSARVYELEKMELENERLRIIHCYDLENEIIGGEMENE